MRPRRAAGIALALLLLAAAFALGLLLTTRSPELLVHPGASARLHRSPRPIEEVRETLASSYYRPVSREVLNEPSIPALIRELGDPNTDYLTAAEYDALKNRTARSYSGVE